MDCTTGNCRVIRLLQRPEDIEVRSISDDDICEQLMNPQVSPLLELDNTVYVKKDNELPTFTATLTDSAISTLTSIYSHNIMSAMAMLKLSSKSPALAPDDIIIPLLLTVIDGGSRYFVGGKLAYDNKADRFKLESIKCVPIDLVNADGGTNEQH